MASFCFLSLDRMCVVIICISYHWVCLTLGTLENLVRVIIATYYHWFCFGTRDCDVLTLSFEWSVGRFS